MHSVFLWATILGSAVLALQLVLSLVGLDTDADFELVDVDLDGGGDLDAGDADAGEGFDLLSVRALSAGTAVFGAAGLALEPVVGSWIAAPLALVPGFAAVLFSAWATRLMFRAESSGTLDLENAVGQTARVNLTVPPAGQGNGLVVMTLQGRTVELRAVTRQSTSFPTGATVSVLSVDPETDTVEIVPTSMIEG